MARTHLIAVQGLMAAALLYGVHAAPAIADGGTDIASAPAIAPGVMEFGNTNDALLPYGCDEQIADFWTIDLIAGDKVTFNWGSESDFVQDIDIFPPGTNDYNIESQHDNGKYVTDTVGENGKEQTVFTASQTGNYPLDFNAGCGSDDPGPYYFTAYVDHGLVLSLQQKPARHHSTTFRLALHTPNGAAVSASTLTATYADKVRGRWTTLTSTRAPYGTTVKWPKPDAGKTESVRVTVSGSGYQTASSTVKVKVS
jgi:hypothetical protein